MIFPFYCEVRENSNKLLLKSFFLFLLQLKFLRTAKWHLTLNSNSFTNVSVFFVLICQKQQPQQQQQQQQLNWSHVSRIHYLRQTLSSTLLLNVLRLRFNQEKKQKWKCITDTPPKRGIEKYDSAYSIWTSLICLDVWF